jgi:glutamine synthetase
VQKRKISRLPQTLLDAVREFESDSLIAETFGEEFQRIFAEQKYKEWTRGFYRVTDDERNEALTYI